MASTRRKSTMACELCRRRRVKCSGSPPCSYCLMHRAECHFETQRPRRGPRPKSSQTADATRDEEQASTGDSTISVGRELPPEPDPADLSTQWEIPSFSSWREPLQLLIGTDATLTSEYNDRRIDLLGHLIELYWTHVHVQQTPPMTAESFFADLKTQKCPSALCYAMCAAAIAYSLNSAVRLVHQGYGLAKKARKCLEGFPPHEYLRRAQTYCVLTLYEISYGSAVNAWSDLAQAKSLLQFARATQAVPDSTGAMMLLDVHIYLTELSFLVGNPKLYRSLGETHAPDWSDFSETERLSAVMKLLVRIQKVRSRELPWLADSQFSQLHNEMNDLLLHEAEVFRPSQATLQQWLEDGWIEHIHSVLIWHCSILALNRVFLLGRSPGTDRQDNATDFDSEMLKQAPVQFLQEKSNMCYASGITIPIICTEVMASDSYFPSAIMGYACYHSAVVLLHYLHNASKERQPEIVRSLQINFAILGALKNFYQTAEDWVEILLAAERDTSASNKSSNTTGIPSACVVGLRNFQDPPLIGLQTPEPGIPGLSDEDRAKQTVQSPKRTAMPQPAHGLTKNSLWLQEYQKSLKEHMGDYGLQDDMLLPASTTPRSGLPALTPAYSAGQPLEVAVFESPNSLTGEHTKTTEDLIQSSTERHAQGNIPPGSGFIEDQNLVDPRNLFQQQSGAVAQVPVAGLSAWSAFDTDLNGMMQGQFQADPTSQAQLWMRPPPLELMYPIDTSALVLEELESGAAWSKAHAFSDVAPELLSTWTTDFDLDMI